MQLHEVIAQKQEEVLARWTAAVQGNIAPDTIHAAELRDHLPRFLDEVATVLRDTVKPSSGHLPLEQGSSAAGHGEQRFRLGFSLDAVVREYGVLRGAIVQTARAARAEVSFDELGVLADAITSGIAYAVSEYAHQRDAELARHANEHFAFIAHELRNPLSSAQAALALLERQGHFPKEGKAIQALRRGLTQTAELIERTLITSRIASGISLKRENTTLTSLFEKAELGALAEAEAKGIELRLRVESTESISVDERLVSSALGNLLRNGVKYSPPDTAVEVRGSISAGRVVIEVEDTCGGLPPGKEELAFAPFVRLDEDQDGFGLGLAIARQAVDAHGGTLRVQNLPGKGCIFVLSLPQS